MKLRPFLLCSLMATSALAGDPSKESPLAPAPEKKDWAVTLALPSWLAATSGTIGVDGHNSHVYLGADTLIKHLDMIGTLSAEIRKGRFGFYGDFLYVSASDGIGNDGLISKVDVRLDQYLIDLEMNYRLVDGPVGWVDLRAGVRYTNLYNKLTISPGDDEIDRASARLVDDIGNRIRDRIEELDLRGRLRGFIADRIDDKLNGGLSGPGPGRDRATLPIAPLGAREPGRLGEIVRAVFDRRAKALADALRAEVEARTEELRAEARRRIDRVKTQISREIASKLKDELDTSFTLAEDWWDPYVGLRGRLNLSKAFYLTAKGDIGGFGIGSDLTWQASGALGCQLSRSIHAEVGYRYLYTDYDKGGFVYDVTQSGAEITVGVTF